MKENILHSRVTTSRTLISSLSIYFFSLPYECIQFPKTIKLTVRHAKLKKEHSCIFFWQILLKHFWNSVHSFTTLVFVFIKGYAVFTIRRILITITYFAKKCILLFLEKWVPSYFTAIPGSIITIPTTRETDLRKKQLQTFQELWSPLFSFFSRGV